MSGGSRTFSVFVSRYAGERSRARPSGVSRHKRVSIYGVFVELHRLAEIRTSDEGLRLAQLALRRSYYLMAEGLRIERTAPEAAALAARSAIETALVGAYVALTPDVAERFQKKQAKNSRRARAHILSTNRDEVVDVLADVGFLSAPLANTLDNFRAAPDFAQMAVELDQHEPFAASGLATYLYNEVYAFLSNFVEHPTPLSLTRHAVVVPVWRRHIQRAARYRPAEPVHPAALTHAVAPAVAALASVIARKLHRPYALFDEWTRDAQFADGFTWSGSPLRHATVSATFATAGLTMHRANAVGWAAVSVGMLDNFREAAAPDQLLAALEMLAAGGSWRSLNALLLGRPIPVRDLPVPDAPDDQIAAHPRVIVAALLLAYAGVWPQKPVVLRDLVRSASLRLRTLEPNAYGRIATGPRPPVRENFRRIREHSARFE